MAQAPARMTEGAIWKRITFFALPILLGNLFQQMYNTADSLIVGNFLGSNALAAVSSSGNLIFLLIGFFSGIAVGAGVVIAKYFGAKDTYHMRLAIHTTAVFGIFAGVVLTVLGYFLAPQILVWMGTPENVMAESVTYFQVYFLGSLGFVLYNAFVGILQAVGDSRHPLYYLIVSSVVNVVLDLLFIAVFHMGVGGAAFATAISQLVSALLCLLQLLSTKESYRISLKELRLDLPMMLQILRFGIPSGLQNSIIGFANVVVQSNINAFGSMAMAGCGAYAKIEGFAFLPITSFTMALTTFIGQNLGAKEYERAKKGAAFGIITTMVLAELIGLVIFIFAPGLTAAFDSTPEVILFGTQRARVACFFFFALAYSHSVAAVMRGAGKAMVPMVVMLVFWCIVRVGILTIATPIVQSIAVVYWVYPITWMLSSIAFFIYYTRANWLHGLD